MNAKILEEYIDILEAIEKLPRGEPYSSEAIYYIAKILKDLIINSKGEMDL